MNDKTVAELAKPFGEASIGLFSQLLNVGQ